MARDILLARESPIKWKIGGLDGALNLTALKDGAMASYVAFGAGFSLTQSLLAGLGVAAHNAVSGMKVRAGAGRKAGSHTGTPFQYVMSYHSKLFRPM